MRCTAVIDSCLLTGMADAFASLLVDTFKVQRLSRTDDGVGGITESWSDHATGIPGMFAQSGFQSMEGNIGASQQAERRWAVYLAFGTDVTESDRIVQTAKSGTAISPMRTFKITTVFANDTIATSVKCECIELPNLT